MRPATIVIMASLLRTCFQNEDSYLGGVRPAFPCSRGVSRTAQIPCPARGAQAHNEVSSICCVVVCSQSAARFDLQRDSSSISLFTFFPPFLSFAFSPPQRCRHDLFFPKNALPTVISVINGRPLTTRFILDRRFVSRGKDRLRGQMWDLVPGQRTVDDFVP